MRTRLVRSLLAQAFVAIALSVAGSGCFCSAMIEDDWWDDDDWGDCSTDADCFEGCICDEGACVETGWCTSSSDCEGTTCDLSRNTCGGGGPGGGTPGSCGDDECPEGCWFDAEAGVCVETMFCAADADCDLGLICQTDRSTCVPEGRSCKAPAPGPGECADDLCPAGAYWDTIGGGCIETAMCAASGDPNCFSDENCNVDESTCIPASRVCEDPVEPGPMGCVYSADCPEGTECLDGVCVVPNVGPAPTGDGCVFNYECGLDGTCIDGDCHENCVDDSTCPIGQICGTGVCWNDTMPAPECALSDECANGGYCINATCFPACLVDTDCGKGEFCKRDVCRPDHRPRPQCQFNSECAAGEECIDAVCRVRCWGDEWCADVGTGSTCDVAWCTFPEEASSNCDKVTPCAAGESCVNGSCSIL